jgi:hypothetical protein
MGDQMREIDEGNSSSVELISTSGEGFVRQGIKEVSAVVSRFSVDPESVRSVEISMPGLSDTEIAEKLGKIEIYDQELKNPDLSTDDGVVQAAVVTEAKVLSLIEAIPDKKVQSRLQKFGNDILAKTGQVIARVGGKKGVALTMSFLTVLSAACTPAVVGSVMVIPGGGSRATATEVSPKNKELTDYNIFYDGVSMKPTWVGFSEPILVDGEWISPPKNSYLFASEFEVHGELSNINKWKDEKDPDKRIRIKDDKGTVIQWQYANLEIEHNWARFTFIVPEDTKRVEIMFPDEEKTSVDVTSNLEIFFPK